MPRHSSVQFSSVQDRAKMFCCRSCFSISIYNGSRGRGRCYIHSWCGYRRRIYRCRGCLINQATTSQGFLQCPGLQMGEQRTLVTSGMAGNQIRGKTSLE